MKFTYSLVIRLGAILVFSSCLLFYLSEYPDATSAFNQQLYNPDKDSTDIIGKGKWGAYPDKLKELMELHKEQIKAADKEKAAIAQGKIHETGADKDDPFRIPQNKSEWELPTHCFPFDKNEHVCYTISSKFRSPCFQHQGRQHCLPSYIIIGFPKCGTSSLHYYINQHPNVQAPRVKETDYFSHWVDNNHSPSYYTSLFPRISSPQNITGEATTKYGSSLVTPARIQQVLPYVRLIAMIRDPAEQVYSDYLMFVDWVKNEIKNKKGGSLPYPFDEFVRNPQFSTDCWQRNGCGKNGSTWTYECTRKCRRYGEAIYVDWLKNWFSVFPKKQILVLKTEDLKKSPRDIMRQVEDHLSLPHHDYGNLFDTIVNVAENRGIYQVDSAHKLKSKPAESQIADWDTRQLLRKFYQPHVKRLEEFLDMKLNWTKPEPFISELPDSKIHCFQYNNQTNACYSINSRFKNPCFYLNGRKQCLPYFIIIGWPKCGTSSLYWYISQHPNVEKCAVKETNYFEHWSKIDATPKYYTALFPKIRDPSNITGEATTNYGPSIDTPARMFEMLPYVKLIVMLRDPIEQLYSNYLMSQDWMLEHKYSPLPPFDEWISESSKTEECFQQAGCSMLKPDAWKKECTYACPRLGEGIYVDWLQNWFSVYPKDQLLILETEELQRNGTAVLHQVVNFLGLPSFDFTDALAHVVNVRGANRGIYSVTNSTELRRSSEEKDDMSSNTRALLARFYSAHNSRLEALLGRRFERWAKERTDG